MSYSRQIRDVLRLRERVATHLRRFPLARFTPHAIAVAMSIDDDDAMAVLRTLRDSNVVCAGVENDEPVFWYRSRDAFAATYEADRFR